MTLEEAINKSTTDSPLTYIESLRLEKRISEIEARKSDDPDNYDFDVELENIENRIEFGLKRNQSLHLRTI